MAVAAHNLRRWPRHDRLDQFGETVSGIEFAPCEFDGETDVEEATPEEQTC